MNNELTGDLAPVFVPAKSAFDLKLLVALGEEIDVVYRFFLGTSLDQSIDGSSLYFQLYDHDPIPGDLNVTNSIPIVERWQLYPFQEGGFPSLASGSFFYGWSSTPYSFTSIWAPNTVTAYPRLAVSAFVRTKSHAAAALQAQPHAAAAQVQPHPLPITTIGPDPKRTQALTSTRNWAAEQQRLKP
jgi:hypothetical protein